MSQAESRARSEVPDADRVKLGRRARGPGCRGRVGCTGPTVIKWRRQYAEGGPAGLEDAPRPGGQRTVLTRKIEVSHDSVSRLWRRFILQPHRTERFKFSTDPQLDAKARDVVGLYLNPRQNAVVVCIDEKS